jgi:hypothetical protein
VLITRGQPPQSTVTVLVVIVEYAVAVLPADRSGWTTSVVGQAAGCTPFCGFRASLAPDPAVGVGKAAAAGFRPGAVVVAGATSAVRCTIAADGRQMVLQEV